MADSPPSLDKQLSRDERLRELLDVVRYSDFPHEADRARGIIVDLFRSEKASLDEDAKLDAALHRNAADQLAQMVVDSLPSAGLRSAESYECQIKAQHQVIAERDATIASLRSHEQPIDIEERIRWHKSEARRLTLESIRGGQSSDIGEISDGNAR
jgi:hypothetical protein